jgi:2-keto-4-pentenoate hydratase/2-oxohepta-3-ene-1,7-dioic acid hydratase in catechol pathway
VRLGTVRGADGSLTTVVQGTDGGLSALRGRLPDLLEALCRGEVPVPTAEPVHGPFAAPYRDPGLILGIGLNYRDHAADLDAVHPTASPASFFKGAHTIVGPGEQIVIPPGIGRVTAEAELALVIGRTCYQVSESDAMSYVAGITAVLDQTAEDILRENPRYLTRAKNYPGFFSFGPLVISLDEALDRNDGSLRDLEVVTSLNGVPRRRNKVGHMQFPPEYLVAFHSHVMPLRPGDIISTGTPGAVSISPGDQVTCDLTGLMTLSNPVRAAAVSPACRQER